MRGWIIGVCALLSAGAAQAQNGRLAFECTGTVRSQRIYLEDPASNSDSTKPRTTVFIIDEAKGKIFTYATNLARYVEFCPPCKKVWSPTAVTWSDDHTEMQYDRVSYKSTFDGRLDWQEGTAYDKWVIRHYQKAEKEPSQTKEDFDYPKCVKIDVDTYDFESLSAAYL